MTVLTPTLLLDTDPLPPASRPARSDHSIEDILNLFPSPPAHVLVESAHFPMAKELDFEPDLVAQNSAKRSSSSEEYHSSLSTSGTLSSVASGDTAITSPPTTPELIQMTQMIIASNGIGLLSVESPCQSADAVSMQPNCSRKQATLDQSRTFDHCCTSWEKGYRKLDSAFPPLQEGVMFSVNPHEDLTFAVTRDCLCGVASKGQARNPDTHGLQALRDANRGDRLRDIVYQESCFSGKISRFTALQCLNASTPSSSTGRAQDAPSSSEDTTDRPSTRASCSEGLAMPNSTV